MTYINEGTEALYEHIPFRIREEDARNDYTLKKWMSGAGQYVESMIDFIERNAFDTPDDGGEPGETSEMVDPMTAPSEYIAWLGQLFGVRSENLTESQIREYLASRRMYKSGTREAIALVASLGLTGTKTVQVYTHTTNTGSPGTGGQWDIGIVTRVTETPPGYDPVALVTAAGEKPAGYTLWHRTYEASWDAIEAARPTWVQWESSNWNSIEETGI